MPFEIVRNDITKMSVDAIVNAANCSLLGGGGVDGAIHRAAGPELLAECRTLGGCETGKAKITGGYNLPAKYVIHTVGPVWHGGGNGEKELLTACYRNSLALADEYHCETVAFPMISAGAYGYPKDEAMAVAVAAITEFLVNHEMTVYLVVFGTDSFMTGKKLFRDVAEYIDDVYAEERLAKNRRSGYIRQQLWREDEERALDYDMDIMEGLRSESRPAPAAPRPKQAKPPVLESMTAPLADAALESPDWEEILRKTDEGFSQALLRMIDERGMTDVECYKKANVDRKLFSKIRSNPAYRPGKPTVMAFAVALELNLREAKQLLKKAGFALTHSSTFDIILEYCIMNRIYDVILINQVLFEHDQPLLGSGAGA